MNDSASSPSSGDPRQNLLEAAKLVENAAYDLATTHSSRMVSELIVIAADLDRIANAAMRNGAAKGKAAK